MATFGPILALLLPYIALAFTTSVAMVPSSATAPADYETLRTCLLSCAVPRSNIASRDDAGDSELYAALNWQWNALNGTITPLMYVAARNERDVVAAVRCARGRGAPPGIRVVPKSGGHSYVKHGFGDSDSLIVDLQLLDGVDVNVDGSIGAATATIGAGARQGKIMADLWAAGRWLLPVGGCPTVGLGGYVLGGGFGTFSRWLGLAADYLLEATMVDATGSILTVNNASNPDLFWALRGGGGGNFGIVTSMKFRLSLAPARVIDAVVTYSWDQFDDWFRAWQKWASSPPPSHLVAFTLFNSSKIRTRFISMNGTQTELLSVIHSEFPTPANLVSFDVFSYPEFVVARAAPYWPADAELPLTHISQLVNLSRHNAPGWKRVKSMFVERNVDKPEDLVAMKNLFLEYVRHPEVQFSFEQQGGAIANVDPTDTAFVHRARVLVGVQLQVFSPGGEAEEPVEAVAAMEHFYEATKAYWNHTSSYQNYLDLSPGADYLRRYYGDNLERLVAVKARVDPDNVFRNSKSIPLSLP